MFHFANFSSLEKESCKKMSAGCLISGAKSFHNYGVIWKLKIRVSSQVETAKGKQTFTLPGSYLLSTVTPFSLHCYFFFLVEIKNILLESDKCGLLIKLDS